MISKTRIVMLALAASMAAGCASIAPVAPADPTAPVVTTDANATAQRRVYTAKASYATLLQAAVVYKELRRCSATVTQPCSDPAIVAQIQKADNVAVVAMDAAEAAVRTPQVGNTALERALATADSALAALSALLSNLAR